MQSVAETCVDDSDYNFDDDSEEEEEEEED